MVIVDRMGEGGACDHGRIDFLYFCSFGEDWMGSGYVCDFLGRGRCGAWNSKKMRRMEKGKEIEKNGVCDWLPGWVHCRSLRVSRC